MLKLILALLLPLTVSAQTAYEAVHTNRTLATNVLVADIGPVLRTGGGDVAFTLTAASPSNHIGVTVTAYLQFTADGTNWTTTNATDALLVTTIGTAPATARTNIGWRGYSGVRVGGYISSTVTNTAVTNTLGTWR